MTATVGGVWLGEEEAGMGKWCGGGCDDGRQKLKKIKIKKNHTNNTTKQLNQKADKCPISHFSPFNCRFSVVL